MREVKRRARVSVEANWIDRLVSYVNPTAGRNRMQARFQMAIAGGFIGGRKDRKATKDWGTRTSSADADILPDLPILRDRSRDLCRNSPLAGGAINTMVTSIVGSGLKLQARPDLKAIGMSDAEGDAWKNSVETLWRAWAERQHCDATMTQNFYGIQATAFRSVLESGDIFMTLPFRSSRTSPFSLRLQMIEGDRVCNPNYTSDTKDLAGGVALDNLGAPESYWILREHPGALRPQPKTWDNFPAFGANTGRRNVLHVFDKRRPGQTRGYPVLAPVIETLKQLDRYTEAEIMAAVVSGMFSVFITTEQGEGLDLGEVSGAPAASPQAGGDFKLGNGAIVDLAPGEKIEVANPGRPNQAFDPFVQAILRQIGVALELPFELLIKHFTASYSAARAALLEAWRFFRVRREWLAMTLCQPVFETWLEEAVARGLVDAPGFFDDPMIRAAYCGADWVGDAPGAIDPYKEIQAAQLRLQVGVSTLEKETAAFDGSDWESNHQQQVKERAARRRDGLEHEAPATEQAPANKPNDNTDGMTEQ